MRLHLRRFRGRARRQRHELSSRKPSFSRAISARSFRTWICTTPNCSTTASPSAGSRVLIQDGLLINANRLDAVTVTRNTLNEDDVLNLRTPPCSPGTRSIATTTIYDPTALLFGLFTETDFEKSTVNVDLVDVNAGNHDGQRVLRGRQRHRVPRRPSTTPGTRRSTSSRPCRPRSGRFDGARHAVVRPAVDDAARHAEPAFTSPASGRSTSSPRRPATPRWAARLGRSASSSPRRPSGIWLPPLNNQATDVAGGAVGYQIFLDDTRKQLIFEVGGRKDTNNVQQGEIGFGARYQQAFGQHSILLLDGFISQQQHTDMGSGARISWNTKF